MTVGQLVGIERDALAPGLLLHHAMRNVGFFCALLGCVTIAACSNDGDDPPPPPPEQTTWYRDVGPIVANKCMTCHQAGGIAPFSLTEYEDASIAAGMMLEAVETGLMPPWDAEESDDCRPTRPWKDDVRLTAAETEILRDWIADGTPAGDIATLPPIPDTALQGINMTIRPTTGYSTQGDADEFICFIMQPNLDADVKWMTGMQVRPENPKVVHHVVTMAMQPGPELDALITANGVGTGFDCSAGAMMQGSYLLGVWTPGNQPMQTGDDMSLPLIRGGAVIMQIHYHPAGVVNDPDATSLDFRLTDTWPTKMWSMLPIGNAFQAPELLAGPADPGGTPVFYIPANAQGHTEHMRFTVGDLGTSESIPLFAQYPHMHYIGIELSARIERANPQNGEPAEECLIHTPRWNFDWQRSYQYDTATIDDLPQVREGDVLDIFCSYDNTMDNPFVVRALQDAGLTAPVDVFLGEETLDEMCLAIMGAVVDAPPQPMLRMPTSPALTLIGSSPPAN
jgi:hypothetical protein